MKIITRNHQIHRLVLLGLVFCVMTVFGMKPAMGPDGINAYAVHAKGITGDGVNIALLSSGNVRQRHAAFERPNGSAVLLYDFADGAGLSWTEHDTHIAGILISGGSPSHTDQIGVAPGAKIHSGRVSAKQLQARYVLNALDTLILQKNCRIIVTGIQLSSPTAIANGDSYWTQLYDYYAEKYDLIFANAAGNYSPQITIFGDGYNGITTAGLEKNSEDSYRKIGRGSNSGPTLDGRQKPDAAAPTGCLYVPSSKGDDLWQLVDPNSRGLTSYAIPFTAGVAALLLETAGKTAIEDDDRSEVIKAVMVNSTFTDLLDKNGNGNSSSDANTAWNRDYGYGRLNALGAYETLTAGRITRDVPTQQHAGWAYETIPQNAEHTYCLSGHKNQRLVTTVTWHRKLIKLSAAGFLDASSFYLNLKIISPSGKVVIFEVPDKNNLIKIDHLLTEDGEYKIVLQNPTWTDGRDYGMAFELIDAPEQNK